MPRLLIGQPNVLTARCPECGEPLVVSHHARGRAYYSCPAARADFYRARGGSGRKPGARHESIWSYSEADVLALSAGQESSWHRYQTKWAEPVAG